jgi:hypothetical protein
MRIFDAKFVKLSPENVDHFGSSFLIMKFCQITPEQHRFRRISKPAGVNRTPLQVPPHQALEASFQEQQEKLSTFELGNGFSLPHDARYAVAPD